MGSQGVRDDLSTEQHQQLPHTERHVPRGPRAQEWGARGIRLSAVEVGHGVRVEDRCGASATVGVVAAVTMCGLRCFLMTGEEGHPTEI